MEKDTQQKVLKFCQLTKNNKRIEIVFIEHGEMHSVTVYTKRLVGGWKDRNIVETNVSYSIESFEAIAAMYDILRNDPVYKKNAGREIGQALKNRFTAKTNINH